MEPKITHYKIVEALNDLKARKEIHPGSMIRIQFSHGHTLRIRLTDNGSKLRIVADEALHICPVASNAISIYC